MKIHTVKNPFLCREGQFEEGKRQLCVGLDLEALNSTESFRCYVGSYVGSNVKVSYEIDSKEALEKGHKWTNPKGRTVLIIPLDYFTKNE